MDLRVHSEESPESVTARGAGHLSRGEGVHSVKEGLVLSSPSFPSTAR